nr:non capsid protein NS 1 [Hymenolepis microstoma]
MAQLMLDFGNSYKETVSMVLANLRQSRLKEERTKSYCELLNRELLMALSGKPRHDCCCQTRPPGAANSWLECLFKSNGIEPLEFVSRLERVMNKVDNKVNCIVLYGPTNTGKSLLCKIMTEFLLTGTINRRSENSNFAFENLLDRSVAILEEPKINAANANDMKQLLGGEAFEVSVKYKPMQYLQRLPVIVTTNEYLGCRLPDVDAAALESRYYQYTFSTQIASTTVDGELDAAPCKICTCDWAHFYNTLHEGPNRNKENVPPSLDWLPDTQPL